MQPIQTQAVPFTSGSALSMVLGLVGAYLISAVLAGRQLPVIGSERAAFFALAVVGIVMCSVGGIGRVAVPLGWTHPITLIGTMLGVGALAVIAAVASGRTALLAPLAPLAGGSAVNVISGERIALVALGALMLLKWLVGLAKYFL